MSADAPRILTSAQAAVHEICDAFGWPPELKAGHAAAWAKRTRTKLGLELEPFIVEFVLRYGRRDPGPGEWWAYRELYPLNKVPGSFPTPAMVVNTWGRWTLSVAVTVARGGAADLMAYAMERRTNGN